MIAFRRQSAAPIAMIAAIAPEPKMRASGGCFDPRCRDETVSGDIAPVGLAALPIQVNDDEIGLGEIDAGNRVRPTFPPLLNALLVRSALVAPKHAGVRPFRLIPIRLAGKYSDARSRQIQGHGQIGERLMGSRVEEESEVSHGDQPPSIERGCRLRATARQFRLGQEVLKHICQPLRRSGRTTPHRWRRNRTDVLLLDRGQPYRAVDMAARARSLQCLEERQAYLWRKGQDTRKDMRPGLVSLELELHALSQALHR
ncbi:hypothetical protein AEGHOMDF_2677 [Methylobacterium soli]|nr:hypothetical protein AEGHOMDF_2677 [Methylobacterium soli]